VTNQIALCEPQGTTAIVPWQSYRPSRLTLASRNGTNRDAGCFFLKPWVHDCAAELARLIYNRYRNEFITRRLVA
jgi:hypothetical protein